MILRRIYDNPRFDFRSPFDELVRMRRQMDRLAGSLMGEKGLSGRAGVFPAVNLSEDKNSYFLRAELPGLKADDLDIQVKGNNLSISGERKTDVPGENIKYHRRERDAGKFSRVMTLPGEVESDKVEATLVNGILSIVVPKAEKAKPKQITVK